MPAGTTDHWTTQASPCSSSCTNTNTFTRMMRMVTTGVCTGRRDASLNGIKPPMRFSSVCADRLYPQAVSCGEKTGELYAISPRKFWLSCGSLPIGSPRKTAGERFKDIVWALGGSKAKELIHHAQRVSYQVAVVGKQGSRPVRNGSVDQHHRQHADDACSQSRGLVGNFMRQGFIATASSHMEIDVTTASRWERIPKNDVTRYLAWALDEQFCWRFGASELNGLSRFKSHQVTSPIRLHPRNPQRLR